jgi:hypothetical protein
MRRRKAKGKKQKAGAILCACPLPSETLAHLSSA